MRRRDNETRRGWWLALALCGGCYEGAQFDAGALDPPETGGSDDGASEPDDAEPPDAPAACEPGALLGPPHRLRRLTHTEYVNTVQALFGDGAANELSLTPDPGDARFENDTRQLHTNNKLVEDYERTAQQLAVEYGEQWGEPLVACGADSACVTAVLRDLELRIARRPLSDATVARLVSLYEDTQAQGYSAAEAATTVLHTSLQLPQFLYRLDGLDAAEAGGGDVDDWVLASRLSFLIWQSMPDDTLFDLAEQGALVDEAVLEAQARRMMDDPRAAIMFGDFHRQWLQTGRIEDPARSLYKDPEAYPQWTDALRGSMQNEVERFARGVFEDGTGTLSELLASNVTYVDAELAAFYGVEPPTDGWERRELPPEQRSGLLTMPAFLAGHAGPSQPAPVHTGLFVWNELICGSPIGDPSALDIDTALDPVDPDVVKTNRQIWDEQTSVQPCKSCHDTINVLGFAFEQYDAIGRFRTTDNGLPVDASGTLSWTDVDGDFDGAHDLARRLSESRLVLRCVAGAWYGFAHGLSPSSDDEAAIACLGDALEQHDGDLRELVVGIVRSSAFRSTQSTEDSP